MPGPDAIERSQKKLYLSIKSELALFEKKKPKELRKYESSYRSALPRSARAAGKTELLRAIESANVVLVGDFHPFRQSQKGFLRLITESAPQISRPALALECIQRVHQSAVDEYLAGYITVEELRDEIDFEKHWPFPWENYREILLFARSHGYPVLALNISATRKRPATLRERDEAAAEKIAQQIRSSTAATVFVLYGEHHLARNHLPARIREKLGSRTKVVVAHQNNSDLYWKTARSRTGQKPEVLRLAKDEFCIQNAVPWVKLRSYLDWLEGGENWEEESDTPGMIHHYASLLADALSLPALLPHDVEILSPDRIANEEARSFASGAQDQALAQHALSFHRTGYLPQRGTLIVPSATTNSLSEAASYLLWRARGDNGERPTHTSLIAHFLVGYLGSKILNPKRKCNEVADLKRILASLPKKNIRSRAKGEVLTRALTLLQPYLSREIGSRRIPPLRNPKEIESCRLAGYILGERLFGLLLRDKKLLPLVRAWFKSKSPRESRDLLKKTAARIARTSFSTNSKRDLF